MTIHGLKSKLEQLRYHENGVNAPLTSESHNFWSDHWIFKFHTFLETKSQDLSRGFKIKLIWGASQVAALQGAPPRKTCQSYKRPQSVITLGSTSWIWGLIGMNVAF